MTKGDRFVKERECTILEFYRMEKPTDWKFSQFFVRATFGRLADEGCSIVFKGCALSKLITPVPAIRICRLKINGLLGGNRR